MSEEKETKLALVEDLKRAHDVGVPLVAIETADQPAVIRALKNSAKLITKGYNGVEKPISLVMWDAIRGVQSINDFSRAALAQMLDGRKEMALNQLPDALRAAVNLPEDTIFVILNGHLCMPNLIPIQAIANLRDIFAQNNRVLVLLGPAFVLPPELAPDALLLDDPLPSEEDLRVLLLKFCDDAKVGLTDDQKNRAVEAIRGLSEFTAEQALALSLIKDAKAKQLSLDLDKLWQRKRKMINATPGLTVEAPAETFDQLGGLKQIKFFMTRYFEGPRRPRVVILIDEIDKAMAGAGQSGIGDNTGASQDQHMMLLTEMEDHNYNGILPVGPAGTAKSAIARAIAATHKVPCIRFDLGAMKSSLLGSSEQRIRQAMKMIYAIAGDNGAFFVGTCNGIDELSPALRRRFRAGIWFFDLLDEDEREPVGAIQMKRYGLKLKPNELAFWASCKDWSGANIRDCCEMAYSLNVSISDAAQFVVPAGVQDQSIGRLREMADEKFLCAAYQGKYESVDRLRKQKESNGPKRNLKV